MESLKVLLVGVNSKFIHSNLAIRYLKKYTKDLNYECVIKEFSINDREERILEDLLKEKPDMIGFSSYIWNIQMVKDLAKLVCLIAPEIQLFFGGPEVSFDGFTFLRENEGSIIIEGEGEETYKELIEYKIANINKKNRYNIIEEINKIKGLYYKVDNEVFYSGKRALMDINKVEFPYRHDDEAMENKILYYEASRGCPFGCKYCLSATDLNVRFRNIEIVKEELMFFINKKVKLVKFVDRTFNCNVKFAMEIWRFLIEVNTNTVFHFEISADLLTPEEVELLSKAPEGRFQFEVGVQTTNVEILENINRKVNTQNISEKVKQVKGLKNIKQHLDLIAGLPGEDYNSCKNSFNDIYEMNPEEIQLGFLKIIDGTPMKAEVKKWGMKYSPVPPYEILKTNTMGYWELIKLKRVEHVVDKYYNSKKFDNILKYFIPYFSSPFDFYSSLGEFFEEKGYLSRNISNADYYKIFIDFNEEKLNEDNEALKEIIKFDYLLYNKKRWVPEFLDRLLTSEELKAVKNIVVKEFLNLDKNKFHIEKYAINIHGFLEQGLIMKENCYYLYENEGINDTKEVTKYVQKHL
jgi:anaerobic magnesium-protoporphyrin IX monomethyl ester cyclase